MSMAEFDKHTAARRRHQLHSAAYRTRLIAAASLVLGVVAAGTGGYMYIERWSFLDALYMTVITLGTVGYGETHTLSTGGRVFTMLLIVSSLLLLGYAVSTLAGFVVEGELNRLIRGRRMDKRLASLENHIILCGAGRTGSWIADEFRKTKTPFVIVDSNPDVIQELAEDGAAHYVQGDATDDAALLLAGIERARGLVTVLSEDRDNVFVVLSARSLNSRLRIVARVVEEENGAKLRKAGADEIVSPNHIGGMRMASVMIRPTVVAFLDAMLRVTGPSLRLEEIRVGRGSQLDGKTFATADIGRRTGLLVVAIQPREGGYRFNPGGQAVLREGDVIIVMGNREQFDSLEPLNAEV